MQKSFLLGVLLTSLGAITMSMNHQTPNTQPSTINPNGATPSPLKLPEAQSSLATTTTPSTEHKAIKTSSLNPNAEPWRGCMLRHVSQREVSPTMPFNGSFLHYPSSNATPATVAATSPVDDDYAAMRREKSTSPYQDQNSYPSPTRIMAITRQQPHNPYLLDGEECAKTFAAAEKARDANRPFDYYLQQTEASLAILQARVTAQRAIVDQVQRIIDAEEPTARQEISNEFAAIARSMFKRLNITDEQRQLAHQQRNDARHQKALLRKEAARAEKARLKNLVTFVKEEPTDPYLIQQRLESVKALRAMYPFPLDPTQICSLTGEIFDTKTGKTVNS